MAIAVLTAASFLPSDTTLRDIELSGNLIACMPSHNPPLVIANSVAHPGFDVELLQEVSARSGWSLEIRQSEMLGIDPPPLGAPRPECHVIAGFIAPPAASEWSGRPGSLQFNLGFWPGDWALRRRVEREFARLTEEGYVERLAASYGVGTPESVGGYALVRAPSPAARQLSRAP